MSGRRLPLVSGPTHRTPDVNPGTAVRQVLPGRALLVADTHNDHSALLWAAQLVTELDALGRQVPVVLGLAPDAPRVDLSQLFGAAAARVRVVVEARGSAREQIEARGSVREQIEARGSAREQIEARGSAREQNNEDAAPMWPALAPQAGAADDLWVLVGQRALRGARGWLSVLLGAELPLLRWAPGLRALRGELNLALSGAELSYASALARALAAL
jgi:hypothetical protein